MRYLHLVWAALMRRKTRTAFTLLSVVAAFLLFGLLESVNSVVTDAGHAIGAAHRLITVSKTSLMGGLPVSLEAQIRTVPGVQMVSSETLFGGTYQSPKNGIAVIAVPRNFWDLRTGFTLSASGRRAFDTTRTGAIVGAGLARGVGFDLCPRLKALKDRHLFLPRGSEIPAILSSVCHAHLDPAKIEAQWDRMVHLFASVHSGHTSAINALTRFGSAARGDPLYEALVQLRQLLRTVFLAD